MLEREARREILDQNRLQRELEREQREVRAVEREKEREAREVERAECERETQQLERNRQIRERQRELREIRAERRNISGDTKFNGDIPLDATSDEIQKILQTQYDKLRYDLDQELKNDSSFKEKLRQEREKG